MLLGDFARLNARRFARETALICDDRSLTFAEVEAAARGIAARLRSLGVVPGDRVAMLAENCLEFIPAYFGVMHAGAVCVPLNFRCTLAEQGFMVRDCGAKAVFHTPALAERAAELAVATDLPMARIELEPALLGLTDDSAAPPPVDEDATAVIMYTSGTTGRPKGVMLPHRVLVEQSLGIALATRIRHRDRAFVTTPLFHGSGLYITGHSHLSVGASLIVTRRFAAEEVIGLAERHGATTFFGVPTQFALLLDAGEAAAAPPGLLRNAWYGGAPMPPETLARARALWPDVTFQQLYGQTETTTTTVLDADDHDRKPGSCGRELATVEMRVIDEMGHDCPPGIVGEVIVRREAGMIGYFNNPEQTAETIRDGWIHTGDLGLLDDERFLTLVDRKRDMIVSGGENIYPKEIEDALFEHSGVAEAAVVGGKDPKWGEVPVGFVVLRGGAVPPADLERWCEARLARYKVPRTWRFVAELPKTANGKVQKAPLRAML